MSPPTAGQQDARLAALAGTATPEQPGTELARAMLRLRMVAEAQARGATWAQIGAALGTDGKGAKRHVKRLAAAANRELLASQRNG